MKHYKIVFPVLFILIVVGCRKKSSDDYNYYRPYADSISKVDTISQTEIKEETVVKKETKVEIKGVNLNDPYLIVVSSNTVEEFAHARKNDLKNQGYKPEVFMLDDDGWFKVAIQSYSTLKEAKDALAKLKAKNAEFSQAVIVYQKK